jgi:hypothetical protein
MAGVRCQIVLSPDYRDIPYSLAHVFEPPGCILEKIERTVRSYSELVEHGRQTLHTLVDLPFAEAGVAHHETGAVRTARNR